VCREFQQMRNRVTVFRARLLSQVAAVAVLAGMGAGCSGDVSRFREPFFTGSTDNQRQIISDQPMPAPVAVADGAVSKRDLPPPAGVSPAYAMAAAPVDPAPTSPVIARSGSYGWSPTGGEVITVGPGQSLETLSLKYGVPVSEIARANQIHSPADVQAGKVLVIPVKVALAAPAAAPAAHIAPVMPAVAVAPKVAKVKAELGTKSHQGGR